MDYASQQFISRALAIEKLNLTQLTISQAECFFILYNGLNDYNKELFMR